MIDSEGRTYIKIYCCGDCVQYNWTRHRCSLGAHDNGTADDCFYLDCPFLKEEKEQAWIPVSERLPEIKENHVSDTVIVCCDNGNMGFSYLEENIFGQAGWNCEREDDYHEPLGEVLAWMPLPEPYQEADHD